MDPKKHPLVEVAELLNQFRPTGKGMICLYVQHHQLNVTYCNLVPRDLPIIARINSRDVNNGLTSDMWDRIEAKIRTLIKQGVLEWQTQKP